MAGIELDYAFLADYAVVENGKLTAVGASFTMVTVASVPAARMLSLAGRIRAPEGTESVGFEISISAPEGLVQLGFTGQLGAGPTAQHYDGKLGLLFAASMQVPIVAVGLYTVRLSLDGTLVRTLKFEAAVPEPPGAAAQA